jgi:DNA-directed RNA polymerase subunit H (RpoH/RPB5)
MAQDDLEKLLDGEKEKETPVDPSKKVEDKKTEELDPEEQKKIDKKANLDKAITEAEDRLRVLRKEEKEAKQAKTGEEELPKIDDDDPSAKAWNKRIKDSVAPVQTELEQEKAEVRNSAIREFLNGKPALASNTEKLKEVVAEYQRLSQGKISERTKEGVITYLEKAYASVFHEELLEAARGQRKSDAMGDALFSDIAVSKTATAYSDRKAPPRDNLSDEDKAILARWGMSAEEWLNLKKEQA